MLYRFSPVWTITPCREVIIILAHLFQRGPPGLGAFELLEIVCLENGLHAPAYLWPERVREQAHHRFEIAVRGQIRQRSPCHAQVSAVAVRTIEPDMASAGIVPAQRATEDDDTGLVATVGIEDTIRKRKHGQDLALL